MGTTSVNRCIVQENCGREAIIRLQGKFTALDMMGMNYPCMYGGLIPLANIAALI